MKAKVGSVLVTAIFPNWFYSISASMYRKPETEESLSVLSTGIPKALRSKRQVNKIMGLHNYFKKLSWEEMDT